MIRVDYEKILSKITPTRQEKDAVKRFTNKLIKTINDIAESRAHTVCQG